MPVIVLNFAVSHSYVQSFMIPWNPKFLYYCTPLIKVSRYITWRFGRKFRCSDLNLDSLRKVVIPGMIMSADGIKRVTRNRVNLNIYVR